MNRLGKATFYGGFFAFWIMCFYFGFGVLAAIYNGQDVVAFVGQSIIVGFALWFLFGYGFYELHGWIEERNKPREFDRQPNSIDGPNNTSKPIERDE